MNNNEIKKKIMLILGFLNLFFLFGCKEKEYEGVPVERLFSGKYEREFIYAVIDEDINTIERLIKSEKVDVNVMGKDNITPLYLAVFLKKRESFKTVLDLGGDLYIFSEGKTPLYFCTLIADRFGDFFFLEEAFKKGADPNFRGDKFSNWPISAPLVNTKPEYFLRKTKLLLKYSADYLIPIRSGKYEIMTGINLIERMAWTGYFDSVYIVLEQNKNNEKFMAEILKEDKSSLITIIENIANRTDINMAYWNIKDHTYDDFLRTISFLQEHGAEMDLPEDLEAVFEVVP